MKIAIYTYNHNGKAWYTFQYQNHNITVIEEDSDGYEVYENMVEVEAMDTNYFATLTRDVHKNKEMLEKSLAAYLKEGWQFDRFDGTLRALLLCAAWELVHTTDVDATVLVKEYVDLAYAFFSKNEPKMVNALLDTIAKKVRLTGI